ncbi:MAG: hypothetical protein PVH50_12625, partial [Anaerolineae bacterium]
KGLSHPQLWRLTYDYLETLGKKTIEGLGYSYDECAQILAAHRPSQVQRVTTGSLGWYLEKAPETRTRWERALARLLRRRGPRIGDEG